MKVDKSVCTNDTLEDLSRAIRFEAVFSTLVENKILAIKRECEQKKQKKRSFSRILFGKRIFGEQNTVQCINDLEKGTEKLYNNDTINNDIDIDETEFHNEIELIKRNQDIPTTSINTLNNIKCDIIDDLDNDDNSLTSKKNVNQYNIEIQVLRQHDDISAITKESTTTTDSLSIVDKSITISLNKDITQTLTTTPTNSSYRDIDEIIKDPDNSLTGSEATVKFKTNRKCKGSKESLHYLDNERTRLRILEAKSISAQCSPIFPRQKSDDIKLQQQQQQQQQQRHITSDNSDTVSALSGIEKDNEIIINKRIINKKTTTNPLQSSSSGTGTSATIKTNEKKSTRGKSYYNHTDITHLEYDSIISYQTNQSSQGFISSFNQLTSSNLPVITTTSKTKKPYSDTIKLQRMTSVTSGTSLTGGSISSQTNKCKIKQKNKKDNFKSERQYNHHQERQEKNRNIEKDIDESDDEFKKRKRKYRRSQRCSDPVLVYPSSSGLQHCILSRPPNQPIQLQYDEDFIYDVSLQLEPDGNGDLVPSRRKHRHRHHRHGKKKRHKPRKVLIHDLDNRSCKVKVIDPDDLPQRARWTIIATAFLLLVMCLLLVGVTLRMAPIIDDMELEMKGRIYV